MAEARRRSERAQLRFANACTSTPWDRAEEVTFECELELQQHKLALKETGYAISRLGIENSDDHSRGQWPAHLSSKSTGLTAGRTCVPANQHRSDRRHGGETWDNWKICIQKTAEFSPDSVTVTDGAPSTRYIRKELRVLGQDETASFTIADGDQPAWPIMLSGVTTAGYEVSSAYTMVKNREPLRFVYRDSLWHGADMFGTGRFVRVNGVHAERR